MKIYFSGKDSDLHMLIDDMDATLIMNSHWYLHTGGYAHAKIKGKMVYAHRLIMKPPKGMTVDHINRNKLDNRRANLRVCTHQQNCANRPGGVYFHKQTQKWQVKIMRAGKTKCYGLYKTRTEAKLVRATI